MKHYFLILIFIISLVGVNAQITKGTKMLGADIYGSMNSNNTPSSTSNSVENVSRYMTLGITPSVGYFIKDNIALGLGIGYANTHSKNETILTTQQLKNLSISNNNSFNLNPYYRYYIGLSDKLYYFTNLSLNFSYGIGKGKSYQLDSAGNENNINKSTSSSLGFGVSINPGCSYFATDKFALELTIGSLYYNFSKEKSTNPSGIVNQSINQWGGINLSMSSINIGFRYFIRK